MTDQNQLIKDFQEWLESEVTSSNGIAASRADRLDCNFYHGIAQGVAIVKYAEAYKAMVASIDKPEACKHRNFTGTIGGDIVCKDCGEKKPWKKEPEAPRIDEEERLEVELNMTVDMIFAAKDLNRLKQVTARNFPKEYEAYINSTLPTDQISYLIGHLEDTEAPSINDNTHCTCDACACNANINLHNTHCTCDACACNANINLHGKCHTCGKHRKPKKQTFLERVARQSREQADSLRLGESIYRFVEEDLATPPKKEDSDVDM